MTQDPAIDGGRPFDWGRASEQYARYRDIYPEPFYQRIVDLGLCTQGQAVLDLGTGTGVLPRNMRRFGARWTGADPSDKQIEQARRLSRGISIDYLVASAEDAPLPDQCFDVVTACQCFGYFDKARALPNIHRMLKPGGRLVVLWMGWLAEEDEIARTSENLVLQVNPQWTGAGFRRPDRTAADWAPPLFTLRHSVGYDLPVPFTRDSWHGRMLACRGIGASSLPPEAIAAFEQAHKAFLATCPERFTVAHHVTMLVAERAG